MRKCLTSILERLTERLKKHDLPMKNQKKEELKESLSVPSVKKEIKKKQQDKKQGQYPYKYSLSIPYSQHTTT